MKKSKKAGVTIGATKYRPLPTQAAQAALQPKQLNKLNNTI